MPNHSSPLRVMPTALASTEPLDLGPRQHSATDLNMPRPATPTGLPPAGQSLPPRADIPDPSSSTTVPSFPERQAVSVTPAPVRATSYRFDSPAPVAPARSRARPNPTAPTSHTLPILVDSPYRPATPQLCPYRRPTSVRPEPDRHAGPAPVRPAPNPSLPTTHGFPRLPYPRRHPTPSPHLSCRLPLPAPPMPCQPSPSRADKPILATPCPV